MAKPEEESKLFLIYKLRNEKMVSQKNGESTLRIARFLKPCAEHVNKTVGIPNTPLLSEIIPHSLQQWRSKVLFRGWGRPQRRWKEWVDSLAQKYGCIWNQTGICDAIMSSLYEVRRNQNLVLGLSEFWCSDTNSFVFPWGEATITLEDVMILGGFPVIGEEIKIPLPEELVEIEQEMNKQRSVILRSRAKKAAHGAWIKHCMEEKSEFEHVAFLSLWLSRFVFPSLPGETIAKNVFPIAVHLSRGKRMAIAPAVLASLYRDLRLLKEQAMDSKESILLSGPFQLIQLWAFEHFPLTGPSSPNSLQLGEPRVARWHKLSSKINLPCVRSALRLKENFQPRPYAASLENWRHPSYYREIEQFLRNGLSLNEELRSFLQCLQGCELVGVDCKEKYLPHRVAMQFGLDQDLPGDPSGFTFASELVGFFVPPRSFRPGVSERYMKWWKEMMLNREGEIKDVLVQKGYGEIFKDSSPCKENGNGEDFHVSVSSSQASSTKSSGERSHSSRILEFHSKDRKRRFCDWSSDEDDDDDYVLSPRFDRANVSRHATLKSKISSSVQDEKSEGGGCNVSIESKIPKKLPQVSTKSDSEKNHEPVTPKSPSEIKDSVFYDLKSYDSSDDDNLPISFRLKYRAPKSACCSLESSYNKYQNASSSSKLVNENGRKKKLHTTEEEALQDKVTRKPASGVSKGLEGKAAGKFVHELNGIARQVKRDKGCSFNEPRDIDKINRKMHSAKSLSEAKKPTKAGESLCHQNVSKISKLANENGRERKLHTTEEEEILQGKVTKKPANGVSNELEGRAARKCTNELNDIAREVKTEEGRFVNGSIDVDDINWEMKKSKESRGSAAAKGSAQVEMSTKAGGSIYDPIDLIWEMQKSKDSGGSATTKGSAEVEKLTKAGGSIYDPIDLDDYADIVTTVGFEILGQQLEKRVERLEKLLGAI